MSRRTDCLSLLTVILLGGCASQSPPSLFFGEMVTVGIEIGASTPAEGIDFTFGYKDRDVAIIPVSAVNSDGKGEAITAWSDNRGNSDALSVFGQFKGWADKSSQAGKPPVAGKVALGRFFATGLAATSLAEGYKEGWQDQPRKDTSGAQPCRACSMAAQSQAQQSQLQAQQSQLQTQQSQLQSQLQARQPQLQAQPSPPQKEQAHTSPLIFAQTNSVGISFSTSVADQGAHFSLGYTGRDIAFLPVMVRHGDGKLTRLGGGDGTPGSTQGNWDKSDAYSVFGQFKVDTETQSIGLGLSRFFTTGIAARELAEGFKGAIAKELKSQQTQAQPSGNQ